MEKLASRHAITELMSWISLMENIIDEDQDKIMGAVGSEIVQNFLQKYKVRNCIFCLQFLYSSGKAARELDNVNPESILTALCNLSFL